MATLFVLMGPPASGKTTYSRLLADEHGAVVVHVDEVRKTSGYTAFADAQSVVRSHLAAGRSVVLDATHLGLISRRIARGLGRRLGASRELHVMKTAAEECVRRNQSRRGAERVPDHRMGEMLAAFADAVAIVETESWDRIVFVRTPAASQLLGGGCFFEAAECAAYVGPTRDAYGFSVRRTNFQGGSRSRIVLPAVQFRNGGGHGF